MPISPRGPHQPPGERKLIRLFLCGDVMIGRGIDQILPDPCPLELHEHYLCSAADYITLAERVSGRIPAPVGLDYVWGAALDGLRGTRPDARIINLETSVTRSEAYEAKGINYRVSPANARCLQTAEIDCCTLANNHVLDWGQAGLLETLDTLERLGIQTAGAGRNLDEARRPAILDVPGKGRVVVTALAAPSSGAPPHWAAATATPGVNLFSDFSDESAELLCGMLKKARKPGDVSVVSIHWGPNWGYAIPQAQRRFARKLIDDAGVSVIHGHSSHHPKAIDVYRNRPILYGCGDFLNDYEGIGGYEEFRGDLSLMYLADIDAVSGDLAALELTPLRIRRFRLEAAVSEDVDWLARRLGRESAPFGVAIDETAMETLNVRWG